eukprot:CAMPEP_0206176004 /NCGR_PEP_ID=MMETSP1474-20131121/56848_1 /ASSEMBLY_ACC=CAM_ASM_001110 /TAXON_ID=97495 /ORGANISM="Imantonia sp., Strain RCC918" /LENGTH=75 /DNA_ID=CAMNT_0053586717 /DNA_START=49 /DNA_END=273 /DNA_ORIENTATION=-
MTELSRRKLLIGAIASVSMPRPAHAADSSALALALSSLAHFRTQSTILAEREPSGCSILPRLAGTALHAWTAAAG